MSPMPRSSARTTSTFGRDICARRRRRVAAASEVGILQPWKNARQGIAQIGHGFSPRTGRPLQTLWSGEDFACPQCPQSGRSTFRASSGAHARTNKLMDGWPAQRRQRKRPNGVEPESYRELVHDSHRTPVCRVEKAPMLPHAYACTPDAHQGFPPQSSLAARARGRGWVDRSRSRVSSDFPTPHTRAHRVRDNERFVAQPT